MAKTRIGRNRDALPCPKCSGPTAVKDSRGTGHNSIRRRRCCVACGLSFTTLETFAAFDGRQGRTPLTQAKEGSWMDEARAFANLIPRADSRTTDHGGGDGN